MPKLLCSGDLGLAEAAFARYNEIAFQPERLLWLVDGLRLDFLKVFQHVRAEPLRPQCRTSAKTRYHVFPKIQDNVLPLQLKAELLAALTTEQQEARQYVTAERFVEVLGLDRFLAR